ncbi:uncharacterized protein LOC121906430 isoform X3 [Scomber scombrus]|uniref:Uncharacterized protein LOC121906430 isoform X3 n=1 Tax=Scomber scombrus TaxID=13677 RepID=A0AAV1NJ58_SCOSC
MNTEVGDAIAPVVGDKTVSTTMEKGFIFLLIVCNSPTFTSGNNLQFALGCSAVIPCQHKRGDSDVIKWFYSKDIHSKKIQIFVEGKGGTPRYNDSWKDKITARSNGSLVINSFTEDYQGLYWCDICHQDSCEAKMSTVTIVDKEIINETSERVFVTAGSSFTHVCPSDTTKWTFQASNTTALQNSVQGPETDFVTFNKSIHIVNVKREDAGKYTCWTSKCYGHKQKLLTINLCVITVQQSEDSSVSCDVMCDMEFKNIKPNSRLNVETDTGTISVTVVTYGSLHCTVKTTINSTFNSTHEPSITSNKTIGGCFTVSLLKEFVN